MEKTQAQLSGVHVISFIGVQGSGKSTIAQGVAANYRCQHLEASDVVRDLYGNLERKDMPATNVRTATEPDWLANAIADRMTQDYVVLSGVREREVHAELKLMGATLRIIKLWAPEQERFARLLANGKCKTYVEFMEHGYNEMNIGLAELLADSSIPEYVTSGHRTVAETLEQLIRDLEFNMIVGDLV